MAKSESLLLACGRAARGLACLFALSLPLAGPAAAQQGVFTKNGNTDLNAINSGDISLSGNVTNPTISGGIDNSVGNLSAQGASTSFGINDANLNAQGEPIGTYTASVSNTHSSGTNSGTVNVRATITGGSFAGGNNSQSVSATGLSNVISIKTTSAK